MSNELLLKPMTLVNRRGFFGSKGNNANKPFYVVDILVPLSEEDAKNNSFGYELKTKYLEKEQWLQIQPEDIGKEIEFSYGSDDYANATVTGFKLKEYLIPMK